MRRFLILGQGAWQRATINSSLKNLRLFSSLSHSTPYRAAVQNHHRLLNRSDRPFENLIRSCGTMVSSQLGPTTTNIKPSVLGSTRPILQTSIGGAFGMLRKLQTSSAYANKDEEVQTPSQESLSAPSGNDDITADNVTSKGLTRSERKSALEGMGVVVFGLDEPHSAKGSISWENIAGYDEQKREIEDTVLLFMRRPQVYDAIARGTRCKFESIRPRAMLLEGPPGTGKTSFARVIANQAGVPLLYVPIDILRSDNHGESEKLVSKVFTHANKLSEGAIIFFDEIDSLATARSSDMDEATRRMLAVLLREIDGFEQDRKVLVIGATNRKEDLDSALVSRFNRIITLGPPDQHSRAGIAAKYAKQLKKSELEELAAVMEGMSGRDIKDVCQQAEMHWASKIVRSQAPCDDTAEVQVTLPPLQEYLESALKRQKAKVKSSSQKKD